MGVFPLTSEPTRFRCGEEPCAVVKLTFGTVRMAGERIAEYVTEAANRGNRLHVLEAQVEYPSRWLRDGVVVVDPTATGGVHHHNTDAAHAFLPRTAFSPSRNCRRSGICDTMGTWSGAI